MQTLLIGSALLSVFHALIPSHWLPILAVGRQDGWTMQKTMRITLLIGSAHVLSTVLVGVVLAGIGGALAGHIDAFTHWIAPALLISLGTFYIYQHYYHHHFHLHKHSTRWGVVASLAVSMFFSPCLEIEGYFVAAGAYGWSFVGVLAIVYGIATVLGMLLWVRLALAGLQKLDWHAWEHNAGLVTGAVLLLSGILLFLH